MTVKTCNGKIGIAGRLPVIYASGYGLDDGVTRAVDRCGEMLSAALPGVDLEKRCNSDGGSGGACHDGAWRYNLGAWRNPRDERVYFRGVFEAPPSPNLGEIPARDLLYVDGHVSVCSPHYDTPEEALQWLLTWGGRYCPDLKEEL